MIDLGERLMLAREGKVVVKAVWNEPSGEFMMTGFNMRNRFDVLALEINNLYRTLSPDTEMLVDESKGRHVTTDDGKIVMTLEYPISYLELYDMEPGYDPDPANPYRIEERIDALFTDVVGIINDGGLAKCTNSIDTDFSGEGWRDINMWREQHENN